MFELETMFMNFQTDIRGFGAQLDQLERMTAASALKMEGYFNSIKPTVGKLKIEIDTSDLNKVHREYDKLNAHTTDKQNHIKKFGKDFKAVADGIVKDTQRISSAMATSHRVRVDSGEVDGAIAKVMRLVNLVSDLGRAQLGELSIQSTVTVDASRVSSQIESAFLRANEKFEKTFQKDIHVKVNQGSTVARGFLEGAGASLFEGVRGVFSSGFQAVSSKAFVPVSLLIEKTFEKGLAAAEKAMISRIGSNAEVKSLVSEIKAAFEGFVGADELRVRSASARSNVAQQAQKTTQSGLEQLTRERQDYLRAYPDLKREQEILTKKKAVLVGQAKEYAQEFEKILALELSPEDAIQTMQRKREKIQGLLNKRKEIRDLTDQYLYDETLGNDEKKAISRQIAAIKKQNPSLDEDLKKLNESYLLPTGVTAENITTDQIASIRQDFLAPLIERANAQLEMFVDRIQEVEYSREKINQVIEKAKKDLLTLRRSQTETIIPLYEQIAQEFLKTEDVSKSLTRQGLKSGGFQIPKLVADPNLPGGAQGSYRPEANIISVSPEMLKSLQTGEATRDQVEAIIHELRHALQAGFGSYQGISRQQQGLTFPDALQMTPQEEKQLGSNIEYSTAGHTKNKALMRSLEADAYVFAARNVDEIYRAVSQAKQPFAGDYTDTKNALESSTKAISDFIGEISFAGVASQELGLNLNKAIEEAKAFAKKLIELRATIEDQFHTGALPYEGVQTRVQQIEGLAQKRGQALLSNLSEPVIYPQGMHPDDVKIVTTSEKGISKLGAVAEATASGVGALAKSVDTAANIYTEGAYKFLQAVEAIVMAPMPGLVVQARNTVAQYTGKFAEPLTKGVLKSSAYGAGALAAMGGNAPEILAQAATFNQAIADLAIEPTVLAGIQGLSAELPHLAKDIFNLLSHLGGLSNIPGAESIISGAGNVVNAALYPVTKPLSMGLQSGAGYLAGGAANTSGAAMTAIELGAGTQLAVTHAKDIYKGILQGIDHITEAVKNSTQYQDLANSPAIQQMAEIRQGVEDKVIELATVLKESAAGQAITARLPDKEKQLELAFQAGEKTRELVEVGLEYVQDTASLAKKAKQVLNETPPEKLYEAGVKLRSEVNGLIDQAIDSIELATVKLPGGQKISELTQPQLEKVRLKLTKKRDIATAAETSGQPVLGGSAAISSDIQKIDKLSELNRGKALFASLVDSNVDLRESLRTRYQELQKLLKAGDDAAILDSIQGLKAQISEAQTKLFSNIDELQGLGQDTTQGQKLGRILDGLKQSYTKMFKGLSRMEAQTSKADDAADEVEQYAFGDKGKGLIHLVDSIKALIEKTSKELDNLESKSLEVVRSADDEHSKALIHISNIQAGADFLSPSARRSGIQSGADNLQPPIDSTSDLNSEIEKTGSFFDKIKDKLAFANIRLQKLLGRIPLLNDQEFFNFVELSAKDRTLTENQFRRTVRGFNPFGATNSADAYDLTVVTNAAEDAAAKAQKSFEKYDAIESQITELESLVRLGGSRRKTPILGADGPEDAKKEGQALGKNLREGIVNALNKGESILNSLGLNKLGDLFNLVEPKASAGLGGFLDELTGIEGSLGKIKDLALLGGATLIGALFGDDLIRGLDNLSQATQQQEAFRRSLSATINTDADQFMAELATQSDKLGASLVVAQQSAQAMEASLIGTALEGQSIQLLEGFQAAFGLFGSSMEEQQRALLGLQQMTQLSRVSMEELKQIAEATPGAMQAAASAYGVTTRELFRMVENGEVLAEDLVPKLSAQLKAMSGIQGVVDTPQASFNRLSNSALLAQANLGRFPLAIKKMGADVLVNILKLLADNAETLNKVLLSLALAVTTKLAVSFGPMALGMIFSAQAATTLTGAMKGLLALMSANMPLILTFGAAFAAISVFDAVTATPKAAKPFVELNKELKKAIANRKVLDTVSNKPVGVPERPAFSDLKSIPTHTSIKRLFGDEEAKAAFRYNDAILETVKINKEVYDSFVNITNASEQSVIAIQKVLADEQALKGAQELNKELKELKTSLAIAQSQGDSKTGLEIQQKITDIQKRLFEIGQGSIGQSRAEIENSIRQLETMIKAFESLELENPAAFKANLKFLQSTREAKALAEAYRDRLNDASNIKFTNLQKATTELQTQLQLIRAQNTAINTGLAQERANIIGSFGISQAGQAQEQQALSRNQVKQALANYQANERQIKEIEESLAATNSDVIQSIETVLKSRGTTIGEATVEQLQSAQEVLGEQLSDSAQRYLSEVENLRTLKDQAPELEAQTKQAAIDARKAINENAQADREFLNQQEDQHRSLKLAIKDNQRQLKRQYTDAIIEIKQSTREIEAQKLANSIRSQMNKVTGDFADNMAGFIESFFQTIEQITQGRLDERARLVALARQGNDLVINQQNTAYGFSQQAGQIGGAYAARYGAGTLVGISGTTGRSSGSHLDLRYSSAYDPSRSKPTMEHINRFLVDGVPLGSIPVTDKHGSENARRPDHGGIDFGTEIGQRITVAVPIESVSQPEWDPHGGGYYTVVRFTDGVEMSLLHLDPSSLHANIGANPLPVATKPPSQMSTSSTNYGHPSYNIATNLQSFTESQLGDNYGQKATPETLAALRRMQEAARQDGVTLHSQVAYRSFEEQQALFNDAIRRYGSPEAAARNVAPPGYSEHHTGEAIDFRQPGTNNLLGTGREFDWLTRNASRFGFTLSYPEGNNKGTNFEPWHWRYQGMGQATNAPIPVTTIKRLDQGAWETNTQNTAEQNVIRYLARIAAGESAGGTNIGPNPSTGAYGEYQFIQPTRDAILQMTGKDAWSSNKAERDAAAIALIDDVSRQIGQDIMAKIRAGDFSTADVLLGQGRHMPGGFGTFTSLPGGDEASPIWASQANLAKYGPVGTGGTGGTTNYNGSPAPISVNLPDDSELIKQNLATIDEQRRLATLQRQINETKINNDAVAQLKSKIRELDDLSFQQDQQSRQAEIQRLQTELENTPQTDITRLIGEREIKALELGVSVSESERNINLIKQNRDAALEAMKILKEERDTLTGTPGVNPDVISQYDSLISNLKEYAAQTERTQEAEEARLSALRQFTGEALYEKQLNELIRQSTADIDSAIQSAVETRTIGQGSIYARIAEETTKQFEQTRYNLESIQTETELTIKKFEDMGASEERLKPFQDRLTKIKEELEALSGDALPNKIRDRIREAFLEQTSSLQSSITQIQQLARGENFIDIGGRQAEISNQFAAARRDYELKKSDVAQGFLELQGLADQGLGEEYQKLSGQLQTDALRLEEAATLLSPAIESAQLAITALQGAFEQQQLERQPIDKLIDLQNQTKEAYAQLIEQRGDEFGANKIRRDLQNSRVALDTQRQIKEFELEIQKQLELINASGDFDFSQFTEITIDEDGGFVGKTEEMTLKLQEFRDALVDAGVSAEFLDGALTKIGASNASIDALKENERISRELAENTYPSFERALDKSIAEAGSNAFSTLIGSIKAGDSALDTLTKTLLSFAESMLQSLTQLAAQQIFRGIFGAISGGAPVPGLAGGGIVGNLSDGGIVGNLPTGGQALALGVEAMAALTREKQMNGGYGVGLYALTEGELVLNRNEARFYQNLLANGMGDGLGDYYKVGNRSHGGPVGNTTPSIQNSSSQSNSFNITVNTGESNETDAQTMAAGLQSVVENYVNNWAIKQKRNRGLL